MTYEWTPAAKDTKSSHGLWPGDLKLSHLKMKNENINKYIMK